MKAVVVESHDRLPRYTDFNAPVAAEGEVLVAVNAAALSQLVRLQASGNHYSSPMPPFVPGVDGVGRLEDGRRVYFAFPRGPVGAMAEQVAVRADYTVELPDDVDDVTAAAIANPGMSSWAALTERAALKSGETVLVNGANGASGRLAIQIAKHLGAGRVIATARNPACEAELRTLGADAFIGLDQSGERLVRSFREAISTGIDIVLDYLWGPPAKAFITAAAGKGGGAASPRIRFVNIGALAGTGIDLAAGPLRSSGLEILGSGLGSLSNEALIHSIAAMMGVVGSAGLTITTDAMPLIDVGNGWSRETRARLVFTV